MLHNQIETRSAVPLEIREDDPIAAAVAEVEQLRAAAEANRTNLDTRLTTELRGITDRMSAIELRLNRPGNQPPENRNEPSIEQRAFAGFIRQGREALSAEEVRALRVSDDTAGGYLAPAEFNAEMLRNIRLFSPVRTVARVMNTGAPSVKLPKRVGGMTAAWVGENQDEPETTVTFGENEYPVREIAAYVDVSNAILEDSTFDINALLAFEFAEEFGAKEGKAFVEGDGILSPLGFMSDSGLSYTPGMDSSAPTSDGLIDLYHAIKTPYRANAVWGMNSTTLGAVRKLKDGTSGQYLLIQGGMGNAPVTTILGRPVVEMPDMPDVGAGNFPIIFGDFMQGYRIFDRVSISILRDPYSQATKGRTRFHGRRRVAAGVGKAEAIRKLKIATS